MAPNFSLHVSCVNLEDGGSALPSRTHFDEDDVISGEESRVATRETESTDLTLRV